MRRWKSAARRRFLPDGRWTPRRSTASAPSTPWPWSACAPRIAGGGGGSARLRNRDRAGALPRPRLDGRTAWCERRLLARVHRYTLETLRREIEPVSASEFLQFLGCWQHVDEDYGLEGPEGVRQVLRQLAGFDAPAWAWGGPILPRPGS